MRMSMTSQSTRIGGAIVRNGSSSVRRNHIDVKIDHSLSGRVSTLRAHTMCGMAGGTREAVINVAGVFAKARVAQDLVEVMALAAQRIGSVNCEVWIGEKVCQQLARSWSLADLVATLQNVDKFRPVGTIRPGAAKFAIVLAIVAVSTEDAKSHGARGAGPIQIQHLAAQARLRQDATPVMHYRVARRRGGTELRNQVQGIGSGDLSDGEVSVFRRVRRLARTAAVATQAVFELI